MKYLGDYFVDEYINIGVQLHRFSSGAVYAPTGSVTYTFYENNSTSGAPTGGNLAQLNSKTGLYTARVQLSNANGFEADKDYWAHIEATVDGVAAGELFMFRVVSAKRVDVTRWNGTVVPTPDTAGYPKVTIKSGTGTGELNLSSGVNDANVTKFGGSAGTFNGGRPEVNATHLAGTAYASADFSNTMKASINTEADTAASDYGALKPTVSGRTLDVSAGGEAGIDLANVGSPTTTLNLSGTTIKTATDVETDTQDIQSRLPAALVSGRMDSNMQAAGTGVITATVIATDAITDAEISAAACNKIADHVHRRNSTNIEASANGDTLAFRSLYGAIAKNTNKIAVSGSTLTIYKADDSTSLGTQAITTDAAANPITALDTA